ncbi:hypothetical protein GF312_07480 [Candidatus Poribacteria bacterium]|nr:hypothetical protein [Candidatus Poribacteria bacterium]
MRVRDIYEVLHLIIEETHHGIKLSGNDVKYFLNSDLFNMITTNCKVIIGIRTDTYRSIEDEGILPENVYQMNVQGLTPESLQLFIKNKNMENLVEKYEQALNNIKFNPYALFLLSKLARTETPLEEAGHADQTDAIINVVYRLFCEYSKEYQDIISIIVMMDNYLGMSPENLIKSIWKNDLGNDLGNFKDVLNNMIEDDLVICRKNLLLGNTLEISHDLLYQAFEKHKDKIVYQYANIKELYLNLADNLYDTIQNVSAKKRLISFEIYRDLFYSYYIHINKEKIGILNEYKELSEAINKYLSFSHPNLDEAYQIIHELFHLLVEDVLKLGKQGKTLFDDLNILASSITVYLDTKGNIEEKPSCWYELGWLADIIGFDSRGCYIKAAEISEQIRMKYPENEKEKISGSFHLCGYYYWRGGVFTKSAENFEKRLHFINLEDFETSAQKIRCTAMAYEKAYKSQKCLNTNLYRDKAVEYYIKAADLLLCNISTSVLVSELYNKVLDLMDQSDPRRKIIIERIKKVNKVLEPVLRGNISFAVISNEFDIRYADKIACYLGNYISDLKPEFISPDEIENIYQVINQYSITLLFGGMLAPSTGNHVSKLVTDFSLWDTIGSFSKFISSEFLLHGIWFDEVNGNLVAIIAGSNWADTGRAVNDLINNESFKEAIKQKAKVD